MLEVRLLGQFDVRLDGDPVEIPSRPAQSLLAYLILRAGTWQRREKLAGLLWPESDEKSARSNLRHAIWRLRQAIGQSHLLADKIAVAFNAGAEFWLDAAELEEQVESASNALMQAVSVYGGELLPGFYDDWAVLDRERLRALYERKCQVLLEDLLHRQRWRETLEWGERWIAQGHVPEQAYRAMMVASAGLGDIAGVATLYERCRTALQEEHGVEPSPQTREAFDWLVAGRNPKDLLGISPRGESAVQAAYQLMDHWKAQGVEVVDVAGLAVMHALPEEVTFEREQASLLIRSALEHGVELEPWLQRAEHAEAATSALLDALQANPAAKVRLKVVEALASREGEQVEHALLRIVADEETSSVRSAAAVAASERGRVDAVLTSLSQAIAANQGPSALDAFIAVADQVGLPQAPSRYPKLAVSLGLLRRRWQSRGQDLRKPMLRGALGGAVAMIAVANGQLIPAALLAPETVERSLEVVALPVWIVANSLMGTLWGGLLGAALAGGFWLAGALWKGDSSAAWRRWLGGLAGLVHAVFLILLSLIQALLPAAPADLYIPLYVAFGFVVGLCLSLAVPSPRERWSASKRAWRVALASGLIALAALPTVLLIYGEQFGERIILDLLFAAFFPLAMTLSLGRARRSDREAGMLKEGA